MFKLLLVAGIVSAGWVNAVNAFNASLWLGVYLLLLGGVVTPLVRVKDICHVQW